MGQPHDDHFRRLDGIGRVLHLADALQQHLPGAGQRAHAQAVAQFLAAHPFDLRHGGIVERFRQQLGTGQEMHDLEQIIKNRRRIGAVLIHGGELVEGTRRVALQRLFQQIEALRPVGQAQHVAHQVFADFAFGHGDGLIQQ